jgi:hypothetical protein
MQPGVFHGRGNGPLKLFTALTAFAFADKFPVVAIRPQRHQTSDGEQCGDLSGLETHRGRFLNWPEHLENRAARWRTFRQGADFVLP